MTVWLLTVGEPMPGDGGLGRAWRTGMLAEQLVARGHQVVWWSSAFDHFSRRLRSPVDTRIALGPGLAVYYLDGMAYRRNVSLARLRNHHQVARAFARLAPAQQPPDVILSSLPTLELCDAAVKFGKERDIPVALDVRDLWPDVFFDLVPEAVRPIARHMVPWMTAQLRRSAAGASAILGVTDAFVDWGVAAGRRARTVHDRAFPMGYSERAPAEDRLLRAGEFWDGHGIPATGSRPVFCFFGTFGWMFDFETVLKAAAMLNQPGTGARFVLCGGGERLEQLRQAAAGLDNVLFPGFVGPAEIWTLMRRSVAGLAPYRDFRNFDDNLPNKPIEYLSAGLPIVASHVRVLARLADEHSCGLTYPHGDAPALASALRAIADDPARQQAMTTRARALFERCYVAERVYGEMAGHLEGLARAPRGASAIIA